MDLAPVPVRVHDSADEVGVVDLGDVWVVNLLGWRGDSEDSFGGYESDSRKELHVEGMNSGQSSG